MAFKNARLIFSWSQAGRATFFNSVHFYFSWGVAQGLRVTTPTIIWLWKSFLKKLVGGALMSNLSRGGHTHPKLEVFIETRLGPESWNWMFWNLRPHCIRERVVVSVSLVTPHLKITTLQNYQNITFQTYKTWCYVLIGSQNVGLCCPLTIFKSSKSIGKAREATHIWKCWFRNGVW